MITYKFMCSPNNFKYVKESNRMIMVKVGASDLYVKVSHGNFNKTLKDLDPKSGTVTGFLINDKPEYIFINNLIN